MTLRPLHLFPFLLTVLLVSGCSTDTKSTENSGSSVGQAHYGGRYVDGNDNPNNRAQYMGYSLKGVVNIGGTGNTTSPPPAYASVDYTITCLSCHPKTSNYPNGDTNTNTKILKEYASSGHADVAAIPWTVPEAGGTCQRCHTTFGFLHHLENYGPANYDPAAPYRGITLSSPDYSPQWTGTILSTPLNQREEYRNAMQVLICSACHPENGLLTGVLRTPATTGGFVAIWSANSITAQVTFPDSGASNLCIRCHSARRAGPNITSAATTTAHYLPAAATVFSGTTDLVNITENTTSPITPPAFGTKFTGLGYEFLGQANYINPKTFSHKNVGTPGGKGPCVGCHMSGTSGHTLKIITSDTNGTVTDINDTACTGCHGAMPPLWLNDKKTGFHAATEELDALLQLKGFYLNTTDGNFYRDPEFLELLGLGATSAERTASAKQYYDDQATVFGLDYAYLRGAAYNLWLLRYKLGDPAAYVHNSNYTKKILFDTLDYLDDGAFIAPGGSITLSNPLAAAYLDGDSTTIGIQRPQ